MEPFLAALTALSIALGGSGAADIEDRRRAAAEARQLIDEARDRARAAVRRAERADDAVTAARARVALDRLDLIHRRTNPRAMQAQAEQMYESFREQTIRTLPSTIMGGPIGGAVDALGIATALGSEGEEDPWPLVERLRASLRDVEGAEPLPDTLGQYVAAAELREVLADNPQLVAATSAERARFFCEQIGRSMGDRIAHERDLDRQRALQAARDRACTVSAEGELDFPPPAAMFLSHVDRNEVELSYRIDGEAEGRIRLVAALNPDAIEGIGEAAGGAVAGTLGGGSGRGEEATRCSYRTDLELRLTGRNSGDRTTGTVRVSSGHLEKRCGGGHERSPIGNQDARLRWSATERGDVLAFELQIGEMTVPAELRLDTPGGPGG